jgi:hypothetical protein
VPNDAVRIAHPRRRPRPASVIFIMLRRKAMIVRTTSSPEQSLPEHEVQITSFEAMFRIPPTHVLKLRFHSRGDMRPERWVHVRHDDRGQVVARYVSEAVATSAAGSTCRVDWKKFDTGGVLIASGEDWLRQC